MLAIFTLIGLLFIPSVCYAHSGTLLNAISNYLPFLMPILSGMLLAFRRFITRILRVNCLVSHDDKENKKNNA